MTLPEQAGALDRTTLRNYPLYVSHDIRPGDELAWTEGVYKNYIRLGVRIVRGVVLSVEHNIRGTKPSIEITECRGVNPHDIGLQIQYRADRLIFYGTRRKLREGEEFLREQI